MTFREILVCVSFVALVTTCGIMLDKEDHKAKKVVDTSAPLCEITETDGYLVRQPDGTLKAFVLIGEEIWGQGSFVPCRDLKRNVGV